MHLCRQTPNKPVSLQTLSNLGVLYFRLDADNHETDTRLAAIRKVRNYSYTVGACMQHERKHLWTGLMGGCRSCLPYGINVIVDA